MACSFAIVIPAFNVEQQIGLLIPSLREVAPQVPIVVVDDGSTDATARAVGALGKAICLRHEQNRGKGAALQTGMRYAMHTLQARALIFMDGDGQHAPEDLPKFISAYSAKHGNFILGRRELSVGEMPLARILSNRITSALVSLKIRRRIFDSQAGYRLVETALLKKIHHFRYMEYEFETELLIKAARVGARFYHVPIATIYANETSHIKPVADIYKFVKMYLAT